mmetsp:Transcript_23801/g.38215  ORF Transcript_23801/g.38215 Transcript_23801/m.38215 type:complete len:259 (-) Transcript_23801:177-953(-)
MTEDEIRLCSYPRRGRDSIPKGACSYILSCYSFEGSTGSHLKMGKTSVRKLRLLCMHGYMMTATKMQSYIAPLADHCAEIATFECLDGFHIADQAEREHSPGETRGRAWWNAKSDLKSSTPSYVGAEETFTNLEKIINESGPWDGLLGYSQGAAAAAVLCARMKIDVAILIGGFVVRDQSLLKCLEEKSPLETNALIVYGNNDEIVPPERAVRMIKYFKEPEIYSYEGGHKIPSKMSGFQKTIHSYLQQTLKRRLNSK